MNKRIMHHLAKEKINIDIIAEYLHNLRSNWYKYQRDNSTKENIKRREEQSNTKYSDLSEEDKDKDRNLAFKLINNDSNICNTNIPKGNI